MLTRFISAQTIASAVNWIPFFEHWNSKNLVILGRNLGFETNSDLFLMWAASEKLEPLGGFGVMRDLGRRLSRGGVSL